MARCASKAIGCASYAELVNAADGIQLWTRTFDRELKDIFAVQEEIARAVAESLKVTLLGIAGEFGQIATNNVEAHNAYLQGHFHFLRRNVDDLSQSDQLLRSGNPTRPELCPGLRRACRSVDNDWDLTGQRPTAYPKARSDAERLSRSRLIWRRLTRPSGGSVFFGEWKFADGLSRN